MTIYLFGFGKPSQQINQACEKLQQVQESLLCDCLWGEEMEVVGVEENSEITEFLLPK